MGKCTNDFHDLKVHIGCSFCMESFLSSIAQDVCIMRLQAICHVVDLAVSRPPKIHLPHLPESFWSQIVHKVGRCVFEKLLPYLPGVDVWFYHLDHMFGDTFPYLPG